MGRRWILGLSLLSLAFVSGYVYKLPPADTVVKLPPETKVLQEMSKGVAAIAERAKKSLVFVSISKTVNRQFVHPFELFGGRVPKPRQEGIGSGFIVDLDKGYVVTNNHVVEGADKITLRFIDDQVSEAELVGRDPTTDIAVLRIKDKKLKKGQLGEVVLGNSDKLRVGNFVLALGAPFNLEASVTFGVVSGLKRGSMQLTERGDFIQVDAAVNPGNSGGPLVGVDGLVYGINTAILSPSGASSGVGFAVPVNLARPIIESLINGKDIQRGYLGVHMAPLNEKLAKYLGLPANTRGVVIAQVEADGPADKAGIKPRDTIVAVNKDSIVDVGALSNRIKLIKPGDVATLTVFRDGKKKKIEVKIGELPGINPGGAGKKLGKSGIYLGLKLGFKNGLLYVERIEPGAEAARVLEPGDFILGVGASNLQDLKFEKAKEVFAEEIKRARKKDKKGIMFRIYRKDAYRGGMYRFEEVPLD